MKVKVKIIRTLKSVYDMNSIEVTSARGQTYRIKVEQLIPLIEKADWNKNKKQIYTYLETK